ncbi:MAG: 16S rRNA (cytosine(1402)-N(4))-methyltransferase RsmH [Candidatus Peregrinibacteria bacterium]|nr:16S rRNA (cytosine(1402)-N(4))-methyltransferase RsmH [Candidatus Peregrinibacteria bacterium]
MTQKNINSNWSHDPVLKKEILELLFFDDVKTTFDGTFGLGGHAEAILETFPNVEKYIACDLDENHIIFAKNRLKKHEQKLVAVNSNFSAIKKIVQENDIPRPLVILLDLGICSTHVDDPVKGFAFSQDADLKMCFDQKSDKCVEILNEYSLEQLEKILREYGEDPLAHKIAKGIVGRRKAKRIETTFHLRDVVETCVLPQNRKRSLTRVFQAIRIAVNDELEVLKKTLADALEIMQSGDRIGVISYHSLEDRIVKKAFRLHATPITKETKYSLNEEVEPAKFKLLTKKPICPGEEELERNPRSRSAKLRILEKI